MESERRSTDVPDRRRVPRGGRRLNDPSGAHPAIVIADSYEDARSPIARYLGRYGFDVIEAGSAESAAELMALRRPQVLLSGLQGVEAARLYEILAGGPPVAPPIVIVMLSGGDESVPAQATGVLVKPFSLRPMLDELRRMLRGHLQGHPSGAA